MENCVVIRKIVVLGLALAAWPVTASAASPEVCIEYARSIASERRMSIRYDNVDAWIYQQDCGSEISKSQSGESLEIGIPDIIAADGRGGRRQRKSKEWCETNKHLKSSEQAAYEYHDNIVKPALDVLRSCVDAHAANIRVEPVLSPNRTVLAVTLTNNTNNDNLVVSYPTIRGDASCDLMLGEKEEENGRVHLRLRKAVTFNCKRPDLIPQEGLAEAVITLASDGISTPLQFQLPPISRHKLNSDEFDELSSRLAQEDLKLADRVERIENPQSCEAPAEHCVCKNDAGGRNMGVVEICLKTCRGGRVSELKINRVVISEESGKTKCAIGSTATW